MLWAIIVMAVAVCIYWDWEEHAPEKQGSPQEMVTSVPLSSSIRKYEVREERAAS